MPIFPQNNIKLLNIDSKTLITIEIIGHCMSTISYKTCDSPTFPFS